MHLNFNEQERFIAVICQCHCEATGLPKQSFFKQEVSRVTDKMLAWSLHLRNESLPFQGPLTCQWNI